MKQNGIANDGEAEPRSTTITRPPFRHTVKAFKKTRQMFIGHSHTGVIKTEIIILLVFVIALDPEKRKISLGYKTEATNPWTLFNNQFKVGDVAKVKIVKLMTFGAFAEIIPGVDGLIHISQIADRRIGKPEDVLSEGQEVDAKIIDIDEEHKRISLSIRALLAPAAEEDEDAE